MEDKKNSQLYAILGGVITCFICLAVVFLFPKGTSNLKGVNNDLTNNTGNIVLPNNNEEEIALGDTSGCATVVPVCNTGTYNSSTQKCETPASGVIQANCDGPSFKWENNYCYSISDPTITCTKCKNGFWKNGNFCYSCPDDGDTACWDGVKHSCSALDPNAIPVDVENPSACMCKKGYKQDGDSCEICPAGTYSEGDGFACRSCPAGYYCAGGAADPAECPKCNGSVKCFSIPDNASNVNQCYGTVPAGKKITCNSTGCTIEDCEAGTVSASKSVNYSATLKTTCENPPCSVGYYPGANNSCTACEAGFYCPDGTKRVNCPDNKTSNIKAKTADDCYENVNPSACTLSVTKESKHISIDTNNNHNNSYYYVMVVPTGNGCSGNRLRYTAVNGRVDPAQQQNMANGGTYYFKVYPTEACISTSATATVVDGDGKTYKSGTVTFGRLAVEYDWEKETGCWSVDEVRGKYPTSSLEADNKGKDIYFAGYGNCKISGASGYAEKWTRANCGSGGGNPPSDTPTPSDPRHCYLTNNGYEFHNESEAKSHGDWKIADDKVFGDACGPTPGCYMKISDGSYEVLQEQKEGYIYISASTDPNVCKKENWACYTKTTKDAEGKEYTSYVWSGAQPEGYQKATYSKEECQNPACYVHGDKIEWGKYSGIVGYIELEDVTEPECVIPGEGSDACYVGKDGNYVWGKYEDDPNYTLVPSVKDKAQCNNNVPVTPTGTSTSTIIYIFMAILMAFGIGFIYYSTVLNKNN